MLTEVTWQDNTTCLNEEKNQIACSSPPSFQLYVGVPVG
jgi:hypothetical protein